MAAIQRRSGPNVVGYAGLLQPLADGLKLIVKETTIPSNSNKFLFNFAPVLTFFLSLLGWGVIPFGDGIVLSDINLGIMFIFAISSLGVYGVIIAGWSSNSKYAFLGALRSAAQMISYELTMGFIIINIVIMAGSFNLSDIINSQSNLWYCAPQLPMFGMFFICCLAETNRHPFDLMEAEAELVSGFNVEYSGVGFAMFFLGEYGNILLMCSLLSILFLGGWYGLLNIPFIPGPIWFALKIVGFVILFIWVRAAFPRYRYDQLMRLGWKIFLPLSFAYLILTSSNQVVDFTSNLFFENQIPSYFQPELVDSTFLERQALISNTVDRYQWQQFFKAGLELDFDRFKAFLTPQQIAIRQENTLPLVNAIGARVMTHVYLGEIAANGSCDTNTLQAIVNQIYQEIRETYTILANAGFEKVVEDTDYLKTHFTPKNVSINEAIKFTETYTNNNHVFCLLGTENYYTIILPEEISLSGGTYIKSFMQQYFVENPEQITEESYNNMLKDLEKSIEIWSKFTSPNVRALYK